MGFKKYVPGIPVEFLLDLHEAFMGFEWDLCDSPGRSIWDSYKNSMIFLLVFYDISMGLLWGFYWIPFGFSTVCLWYFYGIAMGFLLGFHGGSLGFH